MKQFLIKNHFKIDGKFSTQRWLDPALKKSWILLRFVLRGWIRIRSISDRNRNHYNIIINARWEEPKQRPSINSNYKLQRCPFGILLVYNNLKPRYWLHICIHPLPRSHSQLLGINSVKNIFMSKKKYFSLISSTYINKFDIEKKIDMRANIMYRKEKIIWIFDDLPYQYRCNHLIHSSCPSLHLKENYHRNGCFDYFLVICNDRWKLSCQAKPSTPLTIF